jgi:predicted MPP superfamily phosphohydrolase
VHLSDLPPRPSRGPRIELRRFHGTARHAEQLSHLRIAHLTDQHFGRVTPHAVQEAAIDVTNAVEPDLVVLTGDFVAHSQKYLDQLVATLARLNAPGIAVLGNHDHWSGADEVAKALDRAGILLLRNAHTSISLRHQTLQVVGLDDSYTGHADVEQATKGLDPRFPTLGLSHVAEEADGLWHHGVPLVLSGHTHAGQITLARLHEIALGKLVGHKYVHGLYGARRPNGEDPRGAVYVSAGIGASVMPLRVGERGRREVAVFELGCEAPAVDEHHAEQPPLPGRKPSAKLIEKRRRQNEAKMWRREQAMAKALVNAGTLSGLPTDELDDGDG